MIGFFRFLRTATLWHLNSIVPIIAVACLLSFSSYAFSTPATRMAMANAYFESELYDQALKEYEALLESTGPFPALLNNIGLVWQKKGDFQKAEKYYRESLKIDSDYTDSLNNLGLVYVVSGRLREAIFTLQRAVRLDPYRAEYHESLGLAYEGSDLFDAAIESFKRGIELEPSFDLWRKLGNVLARADRYSEALSALREAAEIDRTRLLPWVDMIIIHYARREYTRSQLTFDELLRTIDRELPYAEDMKKVEKIFRDWYVSSMLHLSRSFYEMDHPGWVPSGSVNFEELQSGGYLTSLHPEASRLLDLADYVIDKEGIPVTEKWGPHPYAAVFVPRLLRMRQEGYEKICAYRRAFLTLAWTSWSTFTGEPMLELDQRELLESGYIPEIMSCPQGGDYEGDRYGARCTVHGITAGER